MYDIPAHKLIDEGYLSNMRIDIFQLQENFRDEYKEHMVYNPDDDITYNKFKETFFPDWTSEKSHLQTYKPRLEWIRDFIEVKRDKKKGNVLIVDSL